MATKTTPAKLLGLALTGIALVASQGCAVSSSRGDAMQMAADVYPTGKKADAVSMPEWVKLYSRSIQGASVVVLRGGIGAIRVRMSTILIYEEIGGEKSTWRILVYDATTASLLESDPGTGRPVLVSNQVAKNADGSADLRFGTKPVRGGEHNWIRTNSEIAW